MFFEVFYGKLFKVKPSADGDCVNAIYFYGFEAPNAPRPPTGNDRETRRITDFFD